MNKIHSVQTPEGLYPFSSLIADSIQQFLLEVYNKPLKQNLWKLITSISTVLTII